MNKFVIKMAMFIFAVALTIGLTSCESKYSKESNVLIQKYSIALTEKNLQECIRLSNILESRDLNSTQTATVRSLNVNLSELIRQNEKEEAHRNAQKNYDEAMRNVKEIETWLENSIGEYERLLKKQRDAETLAEYTEIEKNLVAMEKKKDEKILEREHYLDEARSWQNKMNNY